MHEHIVEAEVPFDDLKLAVLVFASRGDHQPIDELFAQVAVRLGRDLIPIRFILASADDSDTEPAQAAVERIFGTPRLPLDILIQLPIHAAGIAAPARAVLVWAVRAGTLVIERPENGSLVVSGRTARWALTGAAEAMCEGNDPFAILYPLAEQRLARCAFTFAETIRTLTLFGTGPASASNSAFFQAFNASRRYFFGTHKFDHVRPANDGAAAYPANTGVENDTFRSSIACLAMRTAAGRQLVELRNPLQTRPSEYPVSVAAERPLFARAIVAAGDQDALVFVSGTASIVAAASAYRGSATAQARQINQLMAALTSIENLASHGIGVKEVVHVEPAYRLVFVRYPLDATDVIAELDPAAGAKIPLLVTRARMCRDDLLVEVEALLHLSW